MSFGFEFAWLLFLIYKYVFLKQYKYMYYIWKVNIKKTITKKTHLWELHSWINVLQTSPLLLWQGVKLWNILWLLRIELRWLVPRTSIIKPLYDSHHNISERQDSNLQPLASKASILPFEILSDRFGRQRTCTSDLFRFTLLSR